MKVAKASANKLRVTFMVDKELAMGRADQMKDQKEYDYCWCSGSDSSLLSVEPDGDLERREGVRQVEYICQIWT